MRVAAIFRKTVREQRRDLWTLVLTLVTAPFFVFLYWAFFGQGGTYDVLMVNRDGTQYCDGVVRVMAAVTSLHVRLMSNERSAEECLRNRDGDALFVIPHNFGRTIEARSRGERGSSAQIRLVGDPTSPRYAAAAAMAYSVIETYVSGATGESPPLTLREERIGGAGVRSDFESYVPGLLVLAVVMLIFQASMSVARELEAGTLGRLRLARVTARDFLGGVSLVYILVGMLSVCVTFLTASILGFRSQGPMWVAVIVGAVTTLPVVGTGLIVACFSRTVAQAFVVANFPLMLFMFFTGAVFPVPKVAAVRLLGHQVGLFDILPPTQAVVALNKVLALGQGLGDVAFELAALGLLSVVYFIVGVVLFTRQQAKAR